MNSANDKYGSSLERPPGAGKPVDPATRLSELLAQSLEELTRPFDAPRHLAHAAVPREGSEPTPPPIPTDAVREPVVAPSAVDPEPAPGGDQGRIDADKALAELEAELFAAAKQVDSDASIPHTEDHADEHGEHDSSARSDDQLAQLERALMEPLTAAQSEADAQAGKRADAIVSPDAMPRLAPEPEVAEPAEADAAGVIAKVRRLMLISMAVTVIAVGSVFGFIGYRIFKGEGATAKTADKLPAPPTIPNEVTLSIPRGAKIVQSAVTNDRLVLTLDIDGKVEVRTFDVKTLQPAGRLNFSATP